MSQLYPPEFDGAKAHTTGPVRPSVPPLVALLVLHILSWIAVFNIRRAPDFTAAALVSCLISGATSLVVLVAAVPGPGRIVASLSALGLISLFVGSMNHHAAGGMLGGALGVTFFGAVAMLPVWLLQLVFGWEFRWREPQDDAEQPPPSPPAERQFQLWHLFVSVAIVALICAALRIAFGQQMFGGMLQILSMLAGTCIVIIPSLLLSVSILRVRDAWTWSLASIVVLLVGVLVVYAILSSGARHFEWRSVATLTAPIAATTMSLWLLRAGGVVYGPKSIP